MSERSVLSEGVREWVRLRISPALDLERISKISLTYQPRSGRGKRGQSQAGGDPTTAPISVVVWRKGFEMVVLGGGASGKKRLHVPGHQFYYHHYQIRHTANSTALSGIRLQLGDQLRVSERNQGRCIICNNSYNDRNSSHPPLHGPDHRQSKQWTGSHRTAGPTRTSYARLPTGVAEDPFLHLAFVCASQIYSHLRTRCGYRSVDHRTLLPMPLDRLQALPFTRAWRSLWPCWQRIEGRVKRM